LKILILKPSSLGDVVQALPVLRFLKRARPGSKIYWWLQSNLVPLLDGDPDLEGVVPFHRDRWSAPAHWLEHWRSIRWMRKQAFDWVIDLQGLARSGAFAWLANGKLTIGLDEPREGARGFYDRIVARPSFHTHAVDWYLGVLPLLNVAGPGPSLWASTDVSLVQNRPAEPLNSEPFVWLPERPEIAANIRQKWRVGGGPWIILQPGARWSNKRWPAAYYAELVSRLALARPSISFAILGSQDDRPLAQTILATAPERCLDLTGQTSLPEMVEWIRNCAMMITNDTGPMHVAAALRKPLVALFGPTEPRRTGPYGQLDNVLQLQLPCIPCLSESCSYPKPMECLKAISPNSVIQAVECLLKRISGTFEPCQIQKVGQ
jgi:ADP-heptose:LPS heptosyltransferase